MAQNEISVAKFYTTAPITLQRLRWACYIFTKAGTQLSYVVLTSSFSAETRFKWTPVYMNIYDCRCHGLWELTEVQQLCHCTRTHHASCMPPFPLKSTNLFKNQLTFLTWCVTCGHQRVQVRRDTYVEETCGKFLCNRRAAALASGTETIHVVLWPSSAALFHNNKSSGTLMAHGVFFAKPVSAQSSSVSLAEFMHSSKPWPLKQGCLTWRDHSLG